MDGLSIELQGLILSKVVSSLHKVSHAFYWLGKGNVVEFDIKICKYDAKVLNSPLCEMS